MNNSNNEEDVGRGAAGGGGWTSFLYVAATGVGVAALYSGWQTYLAKQKLEKMEKITGYNLAITKNVVIAFSELINIKETQNEGNEEKIATLVSEYIKGLKLLLLDFLEDDLVERQHLFCSSFKPKSEWKKLEDEIKKDYSSLKFVTPGLEKIFSEDRHCAFCLTYLFTGDKKKNGKIMWEQLKEWRTRVKNNPFKP